jgi:hypothetical protein
MDAYEVTLENVSCKLTVKGHGEDTITIIGRADGKVGVVEDGKISVAKFAKLPEDLRMGVLMLVFVHLRKNIQDLAELEKAKDEDDSEDPIKALIKLLQTGAKI